MHSDKAPEAQKRFAADLRTFAAAVLLLVLVVGALHACGDEDLILPGGLPATSTPQNTATPEPTEDEEA